jgi:hypothetical protein
LCWISQGKLTWYMHLRFESGTMGQTNHNWTCE